MKKLLLASVAIALLGGSANAADLGRPRPVYAPVPVIVPVFSWTGCYLGGNVGGIWAKNDWNDPIFGDFGNNTASGVLGGVQGGCNYQVSSLVFGIQGDGDWTNINNDNAGPLLSTTGFPITDRTQIKGLASVTGRVGYAWDRFLGYVKAGGAWERASFALEVNGSPFATATTNRSGWTVGVGGEYALLNWQNYWLTGFIEYDHYGFGTANPGGLSVCTVTVCSGVISTGTGIKTDVDVVKVGINIKSPRIF
jgi:outer membrane immunogenic protein